MLYKESICIFKSLISLCQVIYICQTLLRISLKINKLHIMKWIHISPLWIKVFNSILTNFINTELKPLYRNIAILNCLWFFLFLFDKCNGFLFLNLSDKTDVGQNTFRNVWKDLPNWHKAGTNGFPLYRVTNDTFMADVMQGGNYMYFYMVYTVMNVIVCSYNLIPIYYQKYVIESRINYLQNLWRVFKER